LERGKILSKLNDLQQILSNDLRIFREPFFRGMRPAFGAVTGERKDAPPCAGESGWMVESLELFESCWISGIAGGRHPSGYSESPNLWNSYFNKLKIPGVFFAFDLPNGGELLRFLNLWARLPGALELTITDPFKQEAFPSLQSLPFPVTCSEQVERTNTLNHLIVDQRGRRLLALNTDGLGMVRALRARAELKSKRILLLGAGGTALSIGTELLRYARTLWIVNRTVSRGRAVAEALRRCSSSAGNVRLEIEAGGFEKIDELLPHTDVLINTVSDGCPIGADQAILLPAAAVLAESKYGTNADLVGLAAGKIYVDGRAMLFGQFAEAAEVVHSLLGISRRAHRRAIQSVEEHFLQSTGT
jgi:shikimate 5-dehydrogenase